MRVAAANQKSRLEGTRASRYAPGVHRRHSDDDSADLQELMSRELRNFPTSPDLDNKLPRRLCQRSIDSRRHPARLSVAIRSYRTSISRQEAGIDHVEQRGSECTCEIPTPPPFGGLAASTASQKSRREKMSLDWAKDCRANLADAAHTGAALLGSWPGRLLRFLPPEIDHNYAKKSCRAAGVRAQGEIDRASQGGVQQVQAAPWCPVVDKRRP